MFIYTLIIIKIAVCFSILLSHLLVYTEAIEKETGILEVIPLSLAIIKDGIRIISLYHLNCLYHYILKFEISHMFVLRLKHNFHLQFFLLS